MPFMDDYYDKILATLADIGLFFIDLKNYLLKKLHLSLFHFEAGKGIFAPSGR